MPHVCLATSPIVPTIVFGLVWLAVVQSTLAPLMSHSLLVALAVVVIQAIVNSVWLGNAAIMVIAAGVGTMFIGGGPRSGEVAGFGTGLMIYDLVATRIVGQMWELAVRLASLPFFLGFRLPEPFLGGGDAFLLAVLSVDLARH